MIEKFYFAADKRNFQKLVIFDRDDTLLRDVPSLRFVSDLKWLPGRLELLKKLTEQSALIAIATNQSAIGRGALSISEFNSISEVIRLQLEENGIRLWALVACPHLPFEGCNCRKPKPGLLNRLVEATEQNELKVLFVGNADTDMEAAKAASSLITGVKLEPDSLNNFDLITDLPVEA